MLPYPSEVIMSRDSQVDADTNALLAPVSNLCHNLAELERTHCYPNSVPSKEFTRLSEAFNQCYIAVPCGGFSLKGDSSVWKDFARECERIKTNLPHNEVCARSLLQESKTIAEELSVKAPEHSKARFSCR